MSDLFEESWDAIVEGIGAGIMLFVNDVVQVAFADAISKLPMGSFGVLLFFVATFSFPVWWPLLKLILKSDLNEKDAVRGVFWIVALMVYLTLSQK